MNEELDKTIAELRENINHFKEMIERYRQIDGRLDEMALELPTLSQCYEEVKEKQASLDWNRETTKEHLIRLDQNQQDIKEILSQLIQDIQSIKEENHLGDNWQTNTEGISRLNRDQQSIKDRFDRMDMEQQTLIEHVFCIDRDYKNIAESINSLKGKFEQAIETQRRWITYMVFLFIFFMICAISLAYI